LRATFSEPHNRPLHEDEQSCRLCTFPAESLYREIACGICPAQTAVAAVAHALPGIPLPGRGDLIHLETFDTAYALPRPERLNQQRARKTDLPAPAMVEYSFRAVFRRERFPNCFHRLLDQDFSALAHGTRPADPGQEQMHLRSVHHVCLFSFGC
jgi:hypothetical protein